MRKWITLLMTLLVGASVSYANANIGQVSPEAGYRRDNIDWKTDFPSDSPFLKRNLRFKDLDIFQIGIHGRSTIGCNFYVRANAYWGWILDGELEHKVKTYFSPNYFGDFGVANDRENVIDEKYVYGVGAAIGYPFYFCDCTMVLAPVIGYAVDEQNINVDDRDLDIDDYFFPVDGGCCCEHKWISKWWGPFVGFDFNYRPCGECWNLYAEFEYHWGYFHGKRNVESDFNYFGFNRNRYHSHDADGWVIALGADYDVSCDWTIGLSFKYQDWRADRRRHHHHDDSDYSGREHYTQKWHSYAINLTLGKEF